MVASGGRDYTHGDRLADAEGVADRQRDIADVDLGGISDRHGGQVVEIDLERREVGFRVHTHDLGERLAAIAQGDLNLVGALDDVVVGQDIAVTGENDAGAQARQHALAAQGVFPVELVEEGVGHQRMLAVVLDLARGVDVDHRRCGGVHRGLIAGRAAVALQRRCFTQYRVCRLFALRC